MKIKQFFLPAHWAPYLINNDVSEINGIEDIQAFLKDNNLGAALTCSEEPQFTGNHDATKYGVLSCNCILFDFPVKE